MLLKYYALGEIAYCRPYLANEEYNLIVDVKLGKYN